MVGGHVAFACIALYCTTLGRLHMMYVSLLMDSVKHDASRCKHTGPQHSYIKMIYPPPCIDDGTQAGAASGVAEAVTVQPLDMVKTRFQLSTGVNPSMASAARAIMQEGGVMRFYRGLLPEMAGMVPKTSVMYATYEMSRARMVAWNSGEGR